jgi:hypothetical protein
VEAPLQVLDLLVHDVRLARNFEPGFDFLEERVDAKKKKFFAPKIIFDIG